MRNTLTSIMSDIKNKIEDFIDNNITHLFNPEDLSLKGKSFVIEFNNLIGYKNSIMISEMDDTFTTYRISGPRINYFDQSSSINLILNKNSYGTDLISLIKKYFGDIDFELKITPGHMCYLKLKFNTENENL